LTPGDENNDHNIKKLLTVQDVLDYAQISRGTLYKLIREGLPFIKIGRSIRFNADSINKWFISRENRK